MELSFGLTPLLLLLSGAAAAALSYWAYRRTTPPLSAAVRWFLGGLRFLALFVLLFLLWRPLLERLTTQRVPALVAVLVDASESMAIDSVHAAHATNVSRQVRETLSHTDPAAEVRTFAFGSEPEELPADSIDNLSFSRQRTDLSAALGGARDRLEDQNLRAVILISDGRHNTGRNPIYTAERYDVPVYTIAVGDSAVRRDIKITRVTTNDISYSGLELPVEIGVSATGFEGKRATLTLSANDQVVDSRILDLPSDGAESSVDLGFVPPGPGLYSVVARITQLQGEVTGRNNIARTSVRVLDSRRKILLLSAAPDPDVAALRHVLEADESNEVTVRVQKSGAEFYEGTLPNRLEEFDLIVFSGYPGPGSLHSDVERTASAVRGDVPALFFLSRQTDLSMLRRYLAPLLGVTPETARRTFYDGSLIVTPQGRRHPVLEDLPGTQIWNELPPLAHNGSRWTVAPDATVLATVRVRGIQLTDPSIVVRRIGRRRSAAVLGTGYWRLGNLPEDLAVYESVWPTVVSNLVRWLSAADDDRPVRVRTTQNTFAGDESVGFVGQVYDESLSPVDDATVEVTVVAPDGNEYRHLMRPLGNGRYVMEIDSPGEGTYRYSAEAVKSSAQLGTDSGSFAVGNLTLEFANPTADPVLMRQIAARSGGYALAPDRLDELATRLGADDEFAAVTSESRAEIELWRHGSFAILVITLLTVEWVARKRAGLS